MVESFGAFTTLTVIEPGVVISFDAHNDSPRGQNESLEEREFATKEELSKKNLHQQQQPHIIYITFNDDNVPGNHNNHNINDAVNSL